MHRRRLRTLLALLRAIHAGQLPPGTRQQRRHGRNQHGLGTRIAVCEQGYINFVSCFLFMAFVLGMCLVGNVGRWTNQRIEMQNAVDSAAYSSSLQMARGMNAITATNHMLGELTGLIVVLDAFVGRERLRNGSGTDEVDTHSIREANDRIKNFKEKAPYPSPIAAEVVYGSALHQLDVKYIDMIYKLFVDSPLGKHRSHAALYDAQLALKHNLAMALMFKNGFTIVNTISQMLINLGNVPILVFLKALGWVGELAATAGHIATDYAILGMSKEWILLQSLQTVIQLPVVPAFIKFGESVLIPALSLHADSVTGKSLTGSLPGTGPSAGPMNRAVQETLDVLQSDLNLTGLTTFPLPDQLVLPVEPEPTNDSDSGNGGGGDKLWSEGAKSVPDDSVDGPMQKLSEVFSTILGPIADIKEELGFVMDILDWIIDPPLIGWVTDFLGDIGIVDKEKAREIQGQLDAVTGKFAELDSLTDGLDLLAQGVPKEGYTDNPSRQHLIDHPFDWETERRSQWTRATYPYVDSFRVPIRDLFRKGAGVANASTYYAQWTNRDALIQCYEIRHKDGGLSKPHMHILQGSSPEQKGNELWTDDDPRLAEQMFTLTSYAWRSDPPPRLLEQIFKPPSDQGRVCHAQAMVYNANGRDLNTVNNDDLQPNTGWDTLNWEAPVAAPEWGAPPSDRGRSQSGGLWPWEIPTQIPWDVFTGRSPEPTARVQLNWQAKLIPLTASRFRDAHDSRDLPNEVESVLEVIKDEHFESLIHH